MKAATCPICKINLSFSVKDNVRYCGQCRREFWPVPDADEQQTKTLLEYGDIETVSSESGSSSSSPVLLSDQTDYRGFPESRKKKDYLQEAFGSHVKITSRVDYPS